MQLEMLSLIFAFVVLQCGLTNGAAEPNAAEVFARHGYWYDEPVINDVAPEDFLIMPWGWTAGSEPTLRDIKDCGFNLAGIMAPEHVALAEKVGIKCIVDDPRISRHSKAKDITDEQINKWVAETVTPFKDNPAVFGYYITDIPVYSHFQNLAKWSKAVSKADPGSVPYINILHLNGNTPGSKNYDEYVEQFINTVGLPYLSYDRYSLFDDGSVSETLYLNLSIIRNAALSHNIPFWNIALSNGHFHYAVPTQGGINLQAYATLAYGGRGICWYTYFTTLRGNYRDGAVDQFLHKTPTWDMLRLINLQVRQLCPTYLKLKSVNVFHYPVPASEHNWTASKHLASIGGGKLLVGEFDDPDGVPYVMIVNKDINDSTCFTVKFKKNGRIMQTSCYTGKTIPWVGENNWLAPGSGMLLSLQKNQKTAK